MGQLFWSSSNGYFSSKSSKSTSETQQISIQEQNIDNFNGPSIYICSEFKLS